MAADSGTEAQLLAACRVPTHRGAKKGVLSRENCRPTQPEHQVVIIRFPLAGNRVARGCNLRPSGCFETVGAEGLNFWKRWSVGRAAPWKRSLAAFQIQTAPSAMINTLSGRADLGASLRRGVVGSWHRRRCGTQIKHARAKVIRLK